MRLLVEVVPHVLQGKGFGSEIRLAALIRVRMDIVALMPSVLHPASFLSAIFSAGGP
jgi:hypothetical protein